MKKIFTNFLNALFGTMIYWALIQYNDTGTVDFVKLILTPHPWVIALGVAAGTAVWTKIFNKKEAKEVKT
ncbi:MAG TPA: hypothetical protein VF181_03145 [Balneolaceae bacterium]